KGLTPLVETGGAEAPSFTEHLHGHMVYQQVEQHRGASYQPYVIALIGVLQAEVEVFDGGATELYPHTHGCVLPIGLFGMCTVRDTPVCSWKPVLNFQFIF